MSRSWMPSPPQIEKLVDMLEKHRFLISGPARTAHARERTRRAWEEVAATLNSQENGCIKTWQQWAKYWIDKKAALKKKVSQLHQTRRRTGGGVIEEELSLSAVEERMVCLLGGESFATGDLDLAINPFYNSTNEPESMPQTSSVSSHSPAIMMIQNDEQPATSFHSNTRPDLDPARQNVSTLPEMEPTQHAPESVEKTRNTTSARSFPRRKILKQARQRLLQHRAQRSSQMSYLTRKFIAIEERRVEVEMMFARSMDTLSESFNRTTQSFLQQSLALQSLAESIKMILDKVDE